MIVLLAVAGAAVAVVAGWARMRVGRVRKFGKVLSRAFAAEAAGDMAGAEAAIGEAGRCASRLGRMARPAAEQAIDTLRARMLYRAGELEAAADLSYELLHRARAGT